VEQGLQRVQWAVFSNRSARDYLVVTSWLKHWKEVWREHLYARFDDWVWQVSLSADLPKIHSYSHTIETSMLGQMDLEVASRAFGEPLSAEFADRLQNCYGVKAMIDDEMVGYIWASSCPRYEEGDAPFTYDVQPSPGSIYVFDCFVYPNARGLRIGQLLLQEVLSVCKKMGFQSAFVVHRSSSSEITQLIRRFGFAPVGKLRYQKILGFSHRDLRDLKLIDRAIA